MPTYSVSTRNYLGTGPTIVADAGENEIPVAFFSKQDSAFPFDVGAIARNFSALVNGAGASEKIRSEGHSIFYRPQPSGVLIQWQKDGEGVSRPGLQITINKEAIPAKIAADLEDKLGPDFMKNLCDAIQQPAPSAPAPQPGLNQQL